MPLPLIPILAIAGVSGGLIYLIRTRRNADAEPQPALPAEGVVFSDRGFIVRIREVASDDWRWTVSREGHKPRSGMATSKSAAISASVQWVSSRSLPPPKVVRQLPAPKTTPGKPQTEPAPPVPTPPAPVGPPAPIAPVGPVVEPPRPPVPPAPAPIGVAAVATAVEPVGMGTRGTDAMGGQRIVRSGLRFQAKTLTLTDLQAYVADAYETFDPFVDTPAEVVTKMLQGLLPELGVVDARTLQLRLRNDEGEGIWVADAIEQVGRLQHQLLAPGLDPQIVPFAADILAEGIFDTEQRISAERFAYRGRLIFARPSGAGYRWSIRDAVGVHGPSDQVFPTREASNRDAIAAISRVDEEAAA